MHGLLALCLCAKHLDCKVVFFSPLSKTKKNKKYRERGKKNSPLLLENHALTFDLSANMCCHTDVYNIGQSILLLNVCQTLQVVLVVTRPDHENEMVRVSTSRPQACKEDTHTYIHTHTHTHTHTHRHHLCLLLLSQGLI